MQTGQVQNYHPPQYQPPPPGGQPGQGITIVYQTAAPPVKDYSHYKGRAAVVFGVVQLLVGILTIVSVILASYFDLQTNTYEHMAMILIFGSIVGYIPAIFFIISGSIAIASGKRKSSCLIIATMVLAIIALVLFNSGYLIFFGVSFTWVPSERICEDGYHYVGCSQNIGVLVFCVICFILAVIYFGAALGSAILSCQAVCCQPNRQQDVNQSSAAYQQPEHVNPPPAKPGIYP